MAIPRFLSSDKLELPKLPRPVDGGLSASISLLVPDFSAALAASSDTSTLDGRELFIQMHHLKEAGNRADRRMFAQCSGWQLTRVRTVGGLPDIRAALHHHQRGWLWMPRDEFERGRERVKARIQIYNAAVLERRFRWSLTLRKEELDLGIRMATDSIGVREFLKDRERGATGKREPLLHWVSSHMRKNRSDPEAEHEVRAHLRGKRVCEWRGHLVEIRESELEREKELERKGLV